MREFTRVAIYARVSTPFSIKKQEDKEKQTQDIENQIKPLTDYIRNNKGWEKCFEFIDYASGKSTDKRPAFQQMMKDAFEKRIDVVLVWKIDRFARSMQDFFWNVKELDRLGVRFIALTQNIDTDHNSPTGRLLMNIMASFAEFERELIRERINASIENRRAKGESLGRPKVIVNIDTILSLRKDGDSVKTISAKLGVSKNTVDRRIQEYVRRNPQVKKEIDLEIIMLEEV